MQVGGFLKPEAISSLLWSQFQAKQEGDDIFKYVSTSLDHAIALNSMVVNQLWPWIKQYQGGDQQSDLTTLASSFSSDLKLSPLTGLAPIWSSSLNDLASPASLTTWQLCFLLSRCLQHKLVPPLVFPQSLPLLGTFSPRMLLLLSFLALKLKCHLLKKASLGFPWSPHKGSHPAISLTWPRSVRSNLGCFP